MGKRVVSPIVCVQHVLYVATKTQAMKKLDSLVQVPEIPAGVSTRSYVERADVRRRVLATSWRAVVEYSLRRTATLAAALLLPALAGCQSLSTAPVQPPIVHLTDLRIRDVQLFEQRYTMLLRVENPNPRELPINGMAYQVLLNKIELGRGASPQSVTIPPYGEQVVEVDVVSNTFSLLQRVRDIASGTANGVNVSIIGNMSVSNSPQPLPFDFRAEFGGRS